MPCCASNHKPFPAWLLHALFVWCFAFVDAPLAQAQNIADVSNLRIEQSGDGMYLSATMRFDLPPVIEDALIKGVPMTFVAEARVLRNRWYWYDKNVATATRSVRLSYQPLTRRWRISVGSGPGDFSTGTSLSQSFEQLADAMVAVRRIARWKIAEGNEVSTDANHNVDFRFRLDTSQLPRPMQIGITGNADWSISLQRNAVPEAR